MSAAISRPLAHLFSFCDISASFKNNNQQRKILSNANTTAYYFVLFKNFLLTSMFHFYLLFVKIVYYRPYFFALQKLLEFVAIKIYAVKSSEVRCVFA